MMIVYPTCGQRLCYTFFIETLTCFSVKPFSSIWEIGFIQSFHINKKVRFLARTGLIKLQYSVFICLHHVALRNDEQIKAETKLAMVRCSCWTGWFVGWLMCSLRNVWIWFLWIHMCKKHNLCFKNLLPWVQF